MPKPSPLKPFIFNDESQENSYGFSILTEGIDLTRFLKNPVMLSDHWNSNWNVIGKWNDVKKEGAILTGLPEFDTDDKDAAAIGGKVERGFINACSMGIVFDRENLSVIGGKVFLTKCELVEVSVVPVPSNANSVRLMHEDGKVMDEKEIQELSLSIIPSIKNPELNLKIDNMKKIILSLGALMALGFKDQPEGGLDASEVEAKILSLSAELAKVKGEKEALELAQKQAEEKAKAEAKTRIEQKVALAITNGQFKADQKDEMVNLGLTSETALDTVIGSIPVKQNFSGKVTSTENINTSEVKTMDDFQKLSLEAQLAFKNDNPEEYKKLFN